jgi:predicted dehydrogenase
LVHGVLDHRGAGSETAAYGLMRAGDIPVHLSGVVGAGPTTYEWVLRGSRQSYLLSNWRDLFVAEGNDWQPVDLTGDSRSEATRLTLFARAIRGEHTPDLADFAAARRVQQVVEAFHQDG